jgi:predicted metal-dependent phosphoesterase TrpH
VLIDLHTHSTASDGTDSPTELIAAAQAGGLDVLAITDHDTTGGWAEATAALPAGLTLVTGAEFSCVYVADGDGERTSLHLLGYLFDPDHPGLARGEQIVDRMATDGVPITWAQVTELAAGGAVGRPHIARVLVDAGVVADVNAAFAGPLSNDSPYYVGTPDTDVFTAIALVLAAGGVPVFAHPLARHRGKVVGEDVIRAMTAAGLAGIEVNHPDHVEFDRTYLGGLAQELDLVATGSSDYHGRNKATRIGACTTDPSQFDRLVSLARAGQPVCG